MFSSCKRGFMRWCEVRRRTACCFSFAVLPRARDDGRGVLVANADELRPLGGGTVGPEIFGEALSCARSMMPLAAARIGCVEPLRQVPSPAHPLPCRPKHPRRSAEGWHLRGVWRRPINASFGGLSPRRFGRLALSCGFGEPGGAVARQSLLGETMLFALMFRRGVLRCFTPFRSSLYLS
jgi:hypothetical protein